MDIINRIVGIVLSAIFVGGLIVYPVYLLITTVPLQILLGLGISVAILAVLFVAQVVDEHFSKT